MAQIADKYYMIERIKTFITSRQSTLTFEQYMNDFFAHPYHEWIKENRYVRAAFEEMFSVLDTVDQKHLIKGPKIYFLQASGKFSCALNKEKAHTIIVFPELMQLLKSTMSNFALAIVFHELGHIFSNHSHTDIDPIEAQVEADAFAIKYGFAAELENILEDQPESLEKRVRISRLTPHIVK